MTFSTSQGSQAGGTYSNINDCVDACKGMLGDKLVRSAWNGVETCFCYDTSDAPTCVEPRGFETWQQRFSSNFKVPGVFCKPS